MQSKTLIRTRTKKTAAGEPGRVQLTHSGIIGEAKSPVADQTNVSVRPAVSLQRFISLTKTSEHRACTRMSHRSNQEKRPKVTKISVFTVTRQRSSEGDQRTKSGDPLIILGDTGNACQGGIQHSDDTMGYPNMGTPSLSLRKLQQELHSVAYITACYSLESIYKRSEPQHTE